MSGANPALETADDYLMVHRIAEAMAAVCAFDNVTVYADTFADNDRGYFPRQGVLDRLWNPRLGFHVVRHLNAALNGIDGLLTAGDGGSCPGGSFVTLQSDKGPITLALRTPPYPKWSCPCPKGTLRPSGSIYVPALLHPLRPTPPRWSLHSPVVIRFPL